MTSNNYLHLNNVVIQNFLSFEGPITFDFNKHHGLILVYGENKNIKIAEDEDNHGAFRIKNGCGKTALLIDSILFGLFGKTEKNINKPNIINRKAKNNCLVTIDFNINNNHYIIENGITPTYTKLIKNGEDITKSSIKLTQKYIEQEVLKTSYLILKNTHFLSVSDANDIFKLSKWEKREFIEHLFNLKKFGEVWRAAKADANRIEKELDKLYITSSNTAASIEEFRKQEQSFDQNRKDKIKQLKEELNNKKSDMSKLDIDSTNLVNNIEKCKKIIDNLKSKLDEKYKFKNDCEHKIHHLNLTIKNTNKHIEKYSMVLNNICEDCYSNIDTLLDITSNKQLIIDNQKELEQLKLKLEEATSEINEYESKLLKYDNKLIEYNEQLKIIEKNIIQHNFLNDSIIKINNEINKVKNEKSEFQNLIISYENTLNDIRSKTQNKEKILKHLNFLIFMFSEEGIKKYLVSLFIMKLNDRIQYYLNRLGAEYSISVDNEFNFTFLTMNGEAQFENFSSGERRRIVVSTLFGIKDILKLQGKLDCNVNCFDEILDANIDDYAFYQLIEIIKEMDKTSFLTSHREFHDEISVDGLIKLEKFGTNTTIIKDTQVDICQN